MHKFASFVAIVFLTACVAAQVVPTERLLSRTATTDLSTITPAYPLPEVTFTPPAYPAPQLTVLPNIPSPTEVAPSLSTTETTPFIRPTMPPMKGKAQIDALSLYSGDTGWAVQSMYTPSTTQYLYNVYRKILRTTTGFQSWRDVSPPADQSMQELFKMFFFDANTAVGFFYRNFMPNHADTELTGIRTVDGRNTWQVGETMHFTCCLRRPLQMMMLDANRGWMYAEDDGSMGTASLSFFRTVDGGLHWEKAYDSNDQNKIDPQNTMFALGNPFNESGFALIDFNTALYATGRLYSSEDGGKSWQPEYTSLPIPQATSDQDIQAGMGKSEPYVNIPQFWTEKDGVLVGRYYADLQIPPAISTSLPVAEFLYYTHDSGKSWTFLRSPARTGSPFFLDSNTGWYLGKSDPDPSTPTQLYQTTDGGQTWMQIMADCPLPLGSEIHFIDDQMGYAILTRNTYDYLFDGRASQRPSYFFFTHDGGRTWEQVEPGVIPLNPRGFFPQP